MKKKKKMMMMMMQYLIIPIETFQSIITALTMSKSSACTVYIQVCFEPFVFVDTDVELSLRELLVVAADFGQHRLDDHTDTRRR